MKDVNIKNLAVLSERRAGLRPANTLFNYYVGKVDALNRAKISKEKIAKELNVSARTVSNWLHVLSAVNVLKYKYSGTMHLNPEIYFEGTKENFENALETFKRFKSDI